MGKCNVLPFPSWFLLVKNMLISLLALPSFIGSFLLAVSPSLPIVSPRQELLPHPLLGVQLPDHSLPLLPDRTCMSKNRLQVPRNSCPTCWRLRRESARSALCASPSPGCPSSPATPLSPAPAGLVRTPPWVKLCESEWSTCLLPVSSVPPFLKEAQSSLC